MPKKYTMAQKIEWLRFSEAGKTDSWIANNKAGGDPRAVIRGINEARLFEEGKQARIELVKDALRQHQKILMAVIDGLLSVVKVPDVDFMPLYWKKEKDSVFSKPEDIQRLVEQKPFDTETAEFKALRSHLKGDKLWKALDEWADYYAACLKARAALQLKAVEIIKEETGLEPVEQDDPEKDTLYMDNLGFVLTRSALDEIQGEGDGDKFEKAVSIDTTSGHVSFRRSNALAFVPGREEQVKNKILAVRKKLLSYAKEGNLLGIHNSLVEQTRKVRTILEQYKMIGLIPGRCPICQKLGM